MSDGRYRAPAASAALEASGILGGQDAAQAFVDANGAALMVNQMKSKMSDAASQEYGTWILGSLGYLGYGESIECMGGVEAVLLALKKHGGNMKVIRNAARALDGISQDASEASMTDGRLDGLCSVLR